MGFFALLAIVLIAPVPLIILFFDALSGNANA
jgi:hypothetical protein